MKDKFLKNLVLFLVGFCSYITIETLFRGYSYWQMGICGGLAIVILDKINDIISWDIDWLAAHYADGTFYWFGLELFANSSYVGLLKSATQLSWNYLCSIYGCLVLFIMGSNLTGRLH